MLILKYVPMLILKSVPILMPRYSDADFSSVQYLLHPVPRLFKRQRYDISFKPTSIPL